ncbi:MAG: hypothetical protein AAGA22_00265 [Pseudomonadota bacterium]
MGLHRIEAVTLAFVTGLVAYVALIVWSAGTNYLFRTGSIILGASVLMGGAAMISACGIVL